MNMRKTIKSLTQRADEFGEKEYEISYIDRNALSKGYFWGYKDAITDVVKELSKIKENNIFCIEDIMSFLEDQIK